MTDANAANCRVPAGFSTPRHDPADEPHRPSTTTSPRHTSTPAPPAPPGRYRAANRSPASAYTARAAP
jgi:hypothetical protein